MFNGLGNLGANILMGSAQNNATGPFNLGNQMDARAFRMMEMAKRTYPGATMVATSFEDGEFVETITAPTRIPQHPRQETS